MCYEVTLAHNFYWCLRLRTKVSHNACCSCASHEASVRKIYANDEYHVIILVSWIETFIFIRVQLFNEANETMYCHSIYDKQIPPLWNANITWSLLRMRIKDGTFSTALFDGVILDGHSIVVDTDYYAHPLWHHRRWVKQKISYLNCWI